MGKLTSSTLRRHRPHPEERVLFGDEALAWLKPGQDHKVIGSGQNLRIDAEVAVQGRHAWGIAVYPAANPEQRADLERQQAEAEERGELLWVAPAYLRGERCASIVCPKCGHRLKPNQIARRIDHDASHRDYSNLNTKITKDML